MVKKKMNLPDQRKYLCSIYERVRNQEGENAVLYRLNNPKLLLTRPIESDHDLSLLQEGSYSDVFRKLHYSQDAKFKPEIA